MIYMVSHHTGICFSILPFCSWRPSSVCPPSETLLNGRMWIPFWSSWLYMEKPLTHTSSSSSSVSLPLRVFSGRWEPPSVVQGGASDAVEYKTLFRRFYLFQWFVLLGPRLEKLGSFENFDYFVIRQSMRWRHARWTCQANGGGNSEHVHLASW